MNVDDHNKGQISQVAEEALSESEERYRLLFDGSKDAIFFHWLDETGLPGRFIQANEEACRRLGYSREELLKMTPMDIGAPERANQYPMIAEELKTKGSVLFETVHVTKEGQHIPVESHIHLVSLQGRLAVISTSRDITRHKHAEDERTRLEEQLRQAKKMEAVGTLAGGMAHDFNNILAGIMGYGHVLHMKLQPDDPRRAFVEQILAGSERAADLVSKLLAFSRKQMIQPRPSDLNEIVRNAKDSVGRIIGEDIKLIIDHVREPLIVMVDPGQIEQVISNLASNARDAMLGGGTLRISTRATYIDEHFREQHGFGAKGEYALLSVADTGCGMDEATKERVFEPFFTTKEVGKGPGLGLAMVYGVIKQNDGFIDVQSAVARGTEFAIYLPLI